MQGLLIGFTIGAGNPSQADLATWQPKPGPEGPLSEAIADSRPQLDETPRTPTALVGMWVATAPRRLEDELRFLYFHSDGKGLYRYGREGMAFTKSFDLLLEERTSQRNVERQLGMASARADVMNEGSGGIDGATLRLQYRKTGAVVVLRLRASVNDKGQECFTLSRPAWPDHAIDSGASQREVDARHRRSTDKDEGLADPTDKPGSAFEVGTQRYCKVRGAISSWHGGAGSSMVGAVESALRDVAPGELEQGTALEAPAANVDQHATPPGSRPSSLQGDHLRSELLSQDAAQDSWSDGLAGPSPVADHLWMDLDQYATGGVGFAMYQFAPQTDSLKISGWFHHGDFDDWTTEALRATSHSTTETNGGSYGLLTLCFTVARQCEQSHYRISASPSALTLRTDPRDGWFPHTYADHGRSF